MVCHLSKNKNKLKTQIPGKNIITTQIVGVDAQKEEDVKLKNYHNEKFDLFIYLSSS